MNKNQICRDFGSNCRELVGRDEANSGRVEEDWGAGEADPMISCCKFPFRMENREGNWRGFNFSALYCRERRILGDEFVTLNSEPKIYRIFRRVAQFIWIKKEKNHHVVNAVYLLHIQDVPFRISISQILIKIQIYSTSRSAVKCSTQPSGSSGSLVLYTKVIGLIGVI